MAISQAGLPTTGSQSVGNGAVYWVGQDNNIYYKAPGVNGVQNLGAAPSSLGIDNNPNNGYGITANQINLPGANYAATLIQDPALASSNTASTASGPTAAATAAQAYFTNLIGQLTDELNTAKGMQGTGEQNINNAYNTAKAEEDQSYQVGSGQNATARENNINQINENGYNAYNSLMGLLGANGAGVSSAATTGAPYAVAKNMSGERAGADATFNANKQSLDTGYANALNDLLTQKNNNMQTFDTNLLNQEQGLESQIGSAQFDRAYYGGQTNPSNYQTTTNQVADIQNQLGKIFQQYATPSYTPAALPGLNTYNVDPTTISSVNQGTDTSVAPYLPSAQQPNNLLTGSPSPAAAAPGGANGASSAASAGAAPTSPQQNKNLLTGGA